MKITSGISGLLAFYIVFSLIPAGAAATRFIGVKGEGLLADTIYNDDLFVTGNKIKMEGHVLGDVFAFCQEIVQSDTVDGSFHSFAFIAQILGPVGHSYRGAGWSITCNAPVGGNVLLAGQNVTIGPFSVIGRNGDISCGRLIFQGELKGNLKIRADEAVISGRIGGNLEFEKGSLTIGPEAVIIGDVAYKSSQKAEISKSAAITGEVRWEEIEESKGEKDSGPSLGKVFAWIFSIRGYLLLMTGVSLLTLVFSIIPLPTWSLIVIYSIILLISGNIMIALTRDKTRETVRMIGSRFLPSLGLGFVIFFVVPIVSLVIMLTLVGGPLGLAFLSLFGVALFAGNIYVATFIGWKFWRLTGRESERCSEHLCYSIGVILLTALSFIPILGYLLITIAIMIGLGGLAQTFRSKSA